MRMIEKGKLTLDRYGFLIRQLVGRDFKARYKRSVLGVVWSLVNPLLMAFILNFVFSNLYQNSGDHFIVYLLSGLVIFNYFTESTNGCLMSIVSSSGLITKVKVPLAIFPLTKILSSAINMLASLAALVAISLIDGLPLNWNYLLVPYVLVCTMILSFGFGLILASLQVFFRDMAFLYGVLTTVIMYATPLIYPITILPEKGRELMAFNPLHQLIDFMRTIVLRGGIPSMEAHLMCLGLSLAWLLVGWVVFKRNQHKFVLAL